MTVALPGGVGGDAPELLVAGRADLVGPRAVPRRVEVGEEAVEPARRRARRAACRASRSTMPGDVDVRAAGRDRHALVLAAASRTGRSTAARRRPADSLTRITSLSPMFGAGERALRVAGRVDRAARGRPRGRSRGRRRVVPTCVSPLARAARVVPSRRRRRRSFAGVVAVEVALRVADDHRMALRVELQPVRPGRCRPCRTRFVQSFVPVGPYLIKHDVLAAGVRLPVDRPARRERLVDVAGGVDRHAALAVLGRAVPSASPS